MVEITRREVLNNLIRFKDSLLEKPPKSSKGTRSYKVLVNCKTGDMRFPQKVKSLEHRIARKGKEVPGDWKETVLLVDETHFEMMHADVPLKSKDFEPLAWRIIRETLKALNLRAKELSATPPIEEAVLQDLSFLQLTVPTEHIEDLPAWAGTLTREEAEKRLETKVQGTYLIRSADDLTQAMTFHFSEENHLPVKPFLITVVEDELKISDILVLHTPKGWTFYQDDPNLNDLLLYHYEKNPQDLICDVSDTIREPLK